MGKDKENIKSQLEELRKKTRELVKDMSVLKDGSEGFIELDFNNPFHRDWYDGK